MQAAFHTHYAAQCGFCTPGLVLAATALIERKGGPRRAGRGARGAPRPLLPLHRLREDRRRGDRRLARRRRAGRGPALGRGGRARRGREGKPRHEGRRRAPPALRRRRARHRPHALRRRRPRRPDAVGEGAPLPAPPRRDHAPRHVEGRGDEGRARDRHARGRAAERLRPPRGAGRPRRRAAARRRRGALQGPADRRGRGGVGGGGASGRRGDRDRVRGAADPLRHPPGARSRGSADPPLGERLSALRPVQPPPGAQGRHRLGLRQGGRDRRGRLPAAGDRADAARDPGRARRARGERPADDLLVHAGDVLLDGRRRRAPPGAAQQAQVRRRHRRRRLRRQGRHGLRDDLRAARAQVAPRGQVALDARGGVPLPRRRARRGTSRSPTPSRATAGSSAGGC